MSWTGRFHAKAQRKTQSTLWILGGLILLIVLHAGALHQRVGKYEVTLMVPADGLYALEEVEIELRIQDTSRPDSLTDFAPVVRASVEARIEMPEMPGMAAYRETAHPEAIPGDYGVHPTFAHGGDYQLRLMIAPLQERAFEMEFPLRILDAEPKRKARPSRYSVELTTNPKRPKTGEPVELRMVFRDRDNPKGVFSSFETVHESLLHLVMVRTDLAEFAHEHPVLGDDGIFRLRYTFPSGGEYHLFADVAPKGAGSQVLMAKLNVSGPAAVRRQQQTGSTIVELIPSVEPLPIRQTVAILVGIKDASSGTPTHDLEPYLGAPGHLLLVHEDATTFVHSHPADDVEAARDGRLRFLARFPKPGLYRGWVQIKRGGEVITKAFNLRAEAAQ
jgi:hypothetical protein